MTKTVQDLVNMTRQHVGDLSGNVFADAFVLMALEEAVGNGYPNFFRPIKDMTYTEQGTVTGTASISSNVFTITGFTPTAYQLIQYAGDPYYAVNVSGSTCKLAQDPHTSALTFSDATGVALIGNGPLPRNVPAIPIPAVFLATGSAGPFKIDAVRGRLYYSGRKYNTPWFSFDQGAALEITMFPAPLVLFPPDANQYELIMYGRRPTVAPSKYAYSAATSTNVITITGYNPTNGERLVFLEDMPPLPCTNARSYYVVNAATNTCKVALTPGGTAVVFTAAGYGKLMPVDVAVENTDIPNFDNFATWKAAEILHTQAQKSSQYDRKAHGQRRLLAQQNAKNAYDKGRLQPNYATSFDY
jgi:hypothetical protein